MISLRNNLLPPDPGQLVESIVYLQPEHVPELLGHKHWIVDVQCADNYQRSFIVEMQLYLDACLQASHVL